MLFYFIMATMNSAREFLKPKSVELETDLDQLLSVRTLSARADLRGHAWNLFSAGLLADRGIKDGLDRQGLIQRQQFGFISDYKATQLPALNQFLNSIDRKGLGAEVARYKKQIAFDKAFEIARDQFIGV